MVTTPFSARVVSESWRTEATAWAKLALAELGIELRDGLQPQRIRPWSAQFTVNTSTGVVWFKATSRAMSFEPAVHSLLARLCPEDVQPPLAVEPSRGWMLTAQHPTPTRSNSASADWAEAAQQIAQLQQRLSPHRDALLAVGLPDCAPHTVPNRFDRLLVVLAQLPEYGDSALTPDTQSRLTALRPALVDACATLDESRFPSTFQHGDLHPDNVYLHDGRLTIFDFGDSQWANAVETLAVPWGWAQQSAEVDWRLIREAYLGEWQVSVAEFEIAWRAAALSHPVNRALTWWSVLKEFSAQDWANWGTEPVDHLCRMLDT